jgi:hypothetical protein
MFSDIVKHIDFECRLLHLLEYDAGVQGASDQSTGDDYAS